MYLSISSDNWIYVISSVAFWELPALFFVTSFSFFTYYLAKINIEVERNNHDLSSGSILDSINVPLTGISIQKNKKTYVKLNLLKPFFIFFNVLAFISFWIIFFSCNSRLF